MGTPRQLKEFSIREKHDALLLAKETAMDFGFHHARVEALDRLRVLLLPMVEWLDKPIHECFPGPGSTTTKRALPLFGRFGTLCPIALARKGDWITPVSAENNALVVSVSSESLAFTISRSRYDILGAIPWSHRREEMVAAEFAGMKEVVEHCAFLKYLSLGMKGIDETLKEREGRLRIMRHNLSFLSSFVDGIDPLEYDTTEALLPGYAVFERHSRGVSRCSGTYFVLDPVRKEIREKEEHERSIPGSGSCEYYVHEEDRQFGRLENLLHWVENSVRQTSENGCLKRSPLSDEEKRVIADFVGRIRDF